VAPGDREGLAANSAPGLNASRLAFLAFLAFLACLACLP
jgi:hypothetical protein